MMLINPFSIMMTCGKCHCQIPDKSNYCPRCGAKVDSGQPIPDFSVSVRFDLPNEQAITNLIEILSLELARVENKFAIIGALVAAERKGVGITQMVNVYRNFVDISERDAETCMRTWSGRAYNKAAWQRARAYAPYKEWVSAPGSRTRDSHLKMNGVIIPVDELFVVPGFIDRYTHEKIPEALMMYPGDISQGPHRSQICRCRCALAPTFRRSGK